MIRRGDLVQHAKHGTLAVESVNSRCATCVGEKVGTRNFRQRIQLSALRPIPKEFETGDVVEVLDNQTVFADMSPTDRPRTAAPVGSRWIFCRYVAPEYASVRSENRVTFRLNTRLLRKAEPEPLPPQCECERPSPPPAEELAVGDKVQLLDPASVKRPGEGSLLKSVGPAGSVWTVVGFKRTHPSHVKIRRGAGGGTIEICSRRLLEKLPGPVAVPHQSRIEDVIGQMGQWLPEPPLTLETEDEHLSALFPEPPPVLVGQVIGLFDGEILPEPSLGGNLEDHSVSDAIHSKNMNSALLQMARLKLDVDLLWNRMGEVWGDELRASVKRICTDTLLDLGE